MPATAIIATNSTINQVTGTFGGFWSWIVHFAWIKFMIFLSAPDVFMLYTHCS